MVSLVTWYTCKYAQSVTIINITGHIPVQYSILKEASLLWVFFLNNCYYSVCVIFLFLHATQLSDIRQAIQFFTLAHCYNPQLSDIRQAIQFFTLAHCYNPQLSDIRQAIQFFTLAHCYNPQLSDIRQAIQFFTLAHCYNPQLSDIRQAIQFFTLAHCYNPQLSDIRQAIQFFTLAHCYNPQLSDIRQAIQFFTLAHCYNPQLSDIRQAIQFFTLAHCYNPALQLAKVRRIVCSVRIHVFMIYELCTCTVSQTLYMCKTWFLRHMPLKIFLCLSLVVICISQLSVRACCILLRMWCIYNTVFYWQSLLFLHPKHYWIIYAVKVSGLYNNYKFFIPLIGLGQWTWHGTYEPSSDEYQRRQDGGCSVSCTLLTTVHIGQ